MRSISKYDEEELDNEQLARVASEHAMCGVDSYSDVGVGAALMIKLNSSMFESTYTYAGFNIHISGMEYKIHAEQMALFQVILDAAHNRMSDLISLEKLVIDSTRDVIEWRCGHCFQVLAAGCQFFDCDPSEFEIIGVNGIEMRGRDGKPEGVHYSFECSTLQEELGDTYITK